MSNETFIFLLLMFFCAYLFKNKLIGYFIYSMQCCSKYRSNCGCAVIKNEKNNNDSCNCEKNSCDTDKNDITNCEYTTTIDNEKINTCDIAHKKSASCNQEIATPDSSCYLIEFLKIQNSLIESFMKYKNNGFINAANDCKNEIKIQATTMQDLEPIEPA